MANNAKVTVRVGFKLPLLPNIAIFRVRNVSVARFEEGVAIVQKLRTLFELIGVPSKLKIVWEIAD